jgi:glycosyltransferase involved in cell wall biosynthesis
MAVVVLSYGPRATLGAAVRSLLAQDEPAEVILVHSGGGDLPHDLTQSDAQVKVILVSQRLLPGAARNVGIAATQAPFVAFLADDCVASAGWIRCRVQRHRAGARSVASALVCHAPANPVALAAHLSLYYRRMPRTAPAVALRYGASYDRSLFQHYGRFREDLESGEDTEFNQRLAETDAPQWAPDVITIHHGVETLGAFARSQWRRGQRMAQAWRALAAYSPGKIAANALSRTAAILREMWANVEPRHRAAALLSVPFIILGNVAYACGSLAMDARR